MAQTNSWTLISVCKLTSKFRPFERVGRWRAIQMMTYLYPNILISSLQLDKCETVLLMSFVTRVHTDDEYHVPCVPGNWEASETAWSRLVCLHLAAGLSSWKRWHCSCQQFLPLLVFLELNFDPHSSRSVDVLLPPGPGQSLFMLSSWLARIVFQCYSICRS